MQERKRSDAGGAVVWTAPSPDVVAVTGPPVSETGGRHDREPAEVAARAGPLTELLVEASGGNTDALNRLFPLVYDELRLLARSRLHGERPDHTLSPTALVHEAYIRLVDQTRVQWRNRGHFYAVASQAMRRILVNYAEMKKAGKRGGGAAHVSVADIPIALADDQVDDLLALDDALDRLAAFNARGADVVVYRFFGGLTNQEIAELLDTSEVTVRRAWSGAKAWLRRELRAAGMLDTGGGHG
jgi:RNA polymerase sigma factor (TIGR02999 family)